MASNTISTVHYINTKQSNYCNCTVNPGQTQVFYKMGQTHLTQGKCDPDDPGDPDDPTRFNPDSYSYSGHLNNYYKMFLHLINLKGVGETMPAKRQLNMEKTGWVLMIEQHVSFCGTLKIKIWVEAAYRLH